MIASIGFILVEGELQRHLDKAIRSQLLFLDVILAVTLELQNVAFQIVNKLINIARGIENPLIHTGI